MSIKERRDTEKAEMKRKIMKAAIEIIEQESYEKLSIRKIAAKIEYSPTTIYLYYKDKAEIITDMSEELYHKVISDTVAVLENTADSSAVMQVHDIMCAFIKGLCSEPEMVRAVVYSGVNVIFANDSADGTPNNTGISRMETIFAAGIAQRVLKPRVAGTAWMIISALIGFTISCIENQLYQTDNFNRLVEDFVEILLGGLKL